MKKVMPAARQGFTLLLTLIVASVVLVVASGVYGIVLKEIQLSGLGRESEIAFYAADSGAECALYWDIKKEAISTTTPATIDCLGQSFVVGGSLISSFTLNFDNGACARIVIDKSSPSATEVNSFGYNLDCASVYANKVERGIRVTY